MPVNRVLLHLLFVFLAIFGQVGLNISLPRPLWANATSSTCFTHRNNDTTGIMDPYFILSFASFSFVIVFGVITLLILVISRRSITEGSLRFPQWQFMLIGVCGAFNGMLVVFSSPSVRTAPFLKAILGNITIPLTIILRLVILQKRPTIVKLIAAGVALVGLILSLIPIITGMDKDSADAKQKWLLQSTVSRILWPLCFMLGFVLATLMNIFEEKSLKDTRNVNFFYLLFWTSFYQFIIIALFFWLDIIPKFGFSNNSHDFFSNYWFALQCFFGRATCDYFPGLLGTVFIFMYVLTYIGSGLLLRYAEGATYLAVVQSLITPLGALFWSIFATDDCGNFYYEPHADSLTYFSIGGIVLIVPAILLYNIRGNVYQQLDHGDDINEGTPLLN